MAKKLKVKATIPGGTGPYDFDKLTDALNRHADALDRYAKALASPGIETCVLSHLGLTAGDLDTPFSKLFSGIGKPVDVIIEQCGQDCYRLTPNQVYAKIGSKPINTLRAFIRCVGA